MSHALVLAPLPATPRQDFYTAERLTVTPRLANPARTSRCTLPTGFAATLPVRRNRWPVRPSLTGTQCSQHRWSRTVTANQPIATTPELGAPTKKQAASLADLAPLARQSGLWKGKSFIRGRRADVCRALHMPMLLAAYNFAKHREILKRLTPYEYAGQIWAKERKRFIFGLLC